MEKFTFLNWRVLHLQLNALNPKKKSFHINYIEISSLREKDK